MGEIQRGITSADRRSGSGSPFVRRSIAGSAALTLALLGGGGLALALPGEVAAQAAEEKVLALTVTTNADTDSSEPVVPGSLRAAFAAIEADTEATAFEVTIEAGIGPIELVEYLDLNLGPETTAFSLVGASTVIDLGDESLSVLAENEAGIETLSLSGLTVQNGDALNLREAYPAETTLEKLTIDNVWDVRLGSVFNDTMTELQVTDSTLDIEAGAEDGGSDADVYTMTAAEDTSFTNSPVGITTHGAGSHAVTLDGVTMTGAQDEYALSMADGSSGKASLTVTDSSFTENESGAINSERVPTVQLTNTEVIGNAGEAAVLVSANEGQESSLTIEGSTFTGNETQAGALTVRG